MTKEYKNICIMGQHYMKNGFYNGHIERLDMIRMLAWNCSKCWLYNKILRGPIREIFTSKYWLLTLTTFLLVKVNWYDIHIIKICIHELAMQIHFVGIYFRRNNKKDINL